MSDMEFNEANLISRRFSGVIFAASSLFHLLSLCWPQISIPEPPIEHLIFFVLNMVIAYGFTFGDWKNSSMSFIIVPLAVEQWVEHLPRAIATVGTQGNIQETMQNLLTLVFITLVTLRQLVFQHLQDTLQNDKILLASFNKRIAEELNSNSLS